MKRITFILVLSLIALTPALSQAYSSHSTHYSYKSGGHSGHYSYSYYGGHHRRYSPYYKYKYYGHSAPHKSTYYHGSTYGTKSTYYHLYTDSDGYSYFHSPRYGQIYCDNPYNKKYHHSSIDHNIRYYCGNKYY